MTTVVPDATAEEMPGTLAAVIAVAKAAAVARGELPGRELGTVVRLVAHAEAAGGRLADQHVGVQPAVGDFKVQPGAGLARAAIAVGVAGVFMETHPNPAKALSDGPNAVPLSHMRELLETLMALDQITKQQARRSGFLEERIQTY